MLGRDYIVKLKNLNNTEECEITCECIFTGNEYTFRVVYENLKSWADGELIQHALPELEPWERELLISGIGPGVFN